MHLDLKRHERIKMRLRVAGSSLADVARDLGVAATTVTSVSQGYRRSRRIEAAIAAKLGVGAKDLWPSRYEPDGDDRSTKPVGLDCMGGGLPSALYC